MKLKISNKTFYKRHSYEIERFVKGKDSLHIINTRSKSKVFDRHSDLIYLDFDNLNQGIEISNSYDVIVLTDIVELHPDIFLFLKDLKEKLNINGKLVVSSFNYKFKFLVNFLELISLKDSSKSYSYMKIKNLKNITSGLGYDYINTFTKQILPFHFFGLGTLMNTILELFFYIFGIGIKTYSIFRVQNKSISNYSKAIIIPAKNEEGNLERLIRRLPQEQNYEIIIPCGVSEDNTVEVAKELVKKFSNFDIKSFVQTGKGKANAVWEALKIVDSDIVAILDADISVDPETIPNFFEILDKNQADFVNGTRLIYQMEKGSMRHINHLGNRVFQFVVSKVINYPLTDSLCGTKVFRKEHYLNIQDWQKKLVTKDPFGDFDLIFSAAYTGQKIIEYPIHYKSRTYGKTQISRFRDGFKLIKYLLNSYFVLNTSRR